MADNRPSTSEEAQRQIIAALQDNAAKLRKAYAADDKAAIKKYSEESDRLNAQYRSTGTLGNIGAGLASTAVGMLTGLPDLAISGYNYLADKNIPTLRERVLGAAQIPSEAVSKEQQLAYSAPDIATGVVGLAQLTKMGYSGVRNWLQNRKTNELLNKLPEAEQNFFKDLMLKGQGSPNAEVAATIAKLERDPKYAEIFNALKREASVRGVSGVAPTTSRITEEQAATGSALGVQNKLQGLAEARKTAGDQAFTKAFGYAEGKQLVDPEQTLKNIDSLINRYSKQTTPNAERAVEVLTNIRESFQPTRQMNIPGAPSVASERTFETAARDASGMLRPTTVTEPFMTVGGGGTSVKYKTPTEALTVEQVQSVLSEFGKKASQGDSLIKDLALSDEKIISTAIFGGMKDDLSNAFKQASGADRTALGMLIKARKEVSDASIKYNDAVAQGLPAWLKDKRLSEINFEDLYSQYKNATPTQRATFRSYVENTEPEALKNLDSRVWQEFSSKYQKDLPDGLPGTDLASMARDWVKMSPVEKDAIATALGQKTSEFSDRMKDALIFTRRISTGASKEGIDTRELTREASAVVGATSAGYPGAKITQLLGDAFGAFRKGVVSNELAMKTLLTKEGMDFLKTAKLSPGSQKTLEALMKTSEATPSLPAFMAVGTAVSPNQQAAPEQATGDTFNVPDEFKIPEEFKTPTESAPTQDQGFNIPEEFKTSSAPMNRQTDRKVILQAEMAKAQEAFSAATDPAQKQRLQFDIEALNRELSR